MIPVQCCSSGPLWLAEAFAKALGRSLVKAAVDPVEQQQPEILAPVAQLAAHSYYKNVPNIGQQTVARILNIATI